MRRFVAFAIMLALWSCAAKPDIAKIRQSASQKLQEKFDADFGKGKVRVGAVELVQATAPHFEGLVTVKVGDNSIVLPLAVTADSETTIVTVDNSKIRMAIQKKDESAIATLTGKYSDYIFTPSLFARLPERLRRDNALFKGRMEVIVPIEEVSDGYFGSGCQAHSCGADEAAWFLSKDGLTAAAVIMETTRPTDLDRKKFGMEEQLVFHLYGATKDNLPSRLGQWAAQNGMTDMNIAGDGIEYVPPAKN